jgi:GTP-binding protein Era
VAQQRFATVAIVGKPNVGKSSLLNVLVGEKLAIVSEKPQATRQPVIGILTTGDTQLMLVDEPGLLNPSYLLQQAMRDAAVQWVRRADVILYLHPADQKEPPPLESLIPEIEVVEQPTALVLTKTDQAGGNGGVALGDRPVFPVSARKRHGLKPLLEWCRSHAPVRPFRYDTEHLSIQPERFFVTEFVRESAFEHLGQELPYSIAVEVDEFREGSDPLYIRATVYVERETQKSMVIGKQGRTIRMLGSGAREKIEELLGQRVYLDLWVKTLAKWRSKPNAVARFGFRDQIGEPR